MYSFHVICIEKIFIICIEKIICNVYWKDAEKDWKRMLKSVTFEGSFGVAITGSKKIL